MKELGRFQISTQDSKQFAEASGDYNPLHVDPVAARRTQFGGTLIHGICGTIRALDLMFEKQGSPVSLRRLKVNFPKPITQGQEITVFSRDENGRTRLELMAGGSRCQIIDVETVATQDKKIVLDLSDDIPIPLCQTLTIETCTGISTAVSLRWRESLMRALFPAAVKCLPAGQISTLLASTEIVGMHCPGLHSVYARLDLEFDDDESCDNSSLNYTVVSVDDRINRIEMDIANACAKGRIEAFFRAAPAQQASFERILPQVDAAAFANQRALVIGASRGLGEVISKVLGAGGAQLMLTYAAGAADAERVAAEIGELRDTPLIARHDVLSGRCAPEVEEFLNAATHIYYLASPIIEKGENGKWNRGLFDRYMDFYVDGLAALLSHRPASNTSELQIFIPSSVFLDGSVKGFVEYIAAKSAAEAYAHNLQRSVKAYRIIAPRLPRLYSDQTSGVKDTNEGETLRVISQMLLTEFGEIVAD